MSTSLPCPQGSLALLEADGPQMPYPARDASLRGRAAVPGHQGGRRGTYSTPSHILTPNPKTPPAVPQQLPCPLCSTLTPPSTIVIPVARLLWENASAPSCRRSRSSAAKRLPTLLSNYRFLCVNVFSTCHLISSLLHGKLQTRVLPYSPTLPQAVLPFTFGSSLFRNPALFFLTLFIHFSSTGAGLPFRAGCEGGITPSIHSFLIPSLNLFLLVYHSSPSRTTPVQLVTFLLSGIYLFCFLQYTTGPLLGQYFYSGRG
jgi:hypothetical protein